MSFNTIETSVENNNPIELYLFSYNGNTYAYTSSTKNYSITVGDTSYTFSAEYIERGDSLKLGDSSGNKETCIITVPRNNNVALLYQGAPPEQDAVSVIVARIHGSDPNDYKILVNGTVSQVHFTDSKAEMTINVENMLTKNIPRGSLSYYCQNCIYDSKCKLKESDYGVRYVVDKIDHLVIKSSLMAEKPSGYYTDGFIKMGNAYRQVNSHVGDTITIKYPISASDREGSFMAYPRMQ